MLKDWRVAAVVFSLCILGPRPSSVDAVTDPSEAAALRVMYSSLNSPPQLTQWSSTGDDPCGQSWKGVTCTGSRVTEIKLSGLGLSGSMGYSLSSLTSLINLDMSNNNLGGEIPYSLPPNVSQLNLAYNTFNKGIPYSISQMASLKYLNISHNQLQEQLFDAFGQLSSLSTLDLSFNSLPGNLPQSFSSLSSMTSMYLQNNQFTGNIDVLANLLLENLNIENNHFTGWIPKQLQNINLQKNGNSWSSEPAPPPPPGTPPARKRPNHKSGGNESPSDGSGGGNKPGIGGGGIAGIVISIFIVGAIVAFFLMKRRSRRPLSDIEKLDNQPFAPLASIAVQEMKVVQTSSVIKTHSFDTNASINLRPPPIDRHKSFDEDCFPQKPIVAKKANIAPINATSYSVADLQMATDSFSVENLLGEGSFGRVYRGRFDDGKILAVKKIDSSALPAELSEEFTEMVSNISQLHHQNITELVGYCSEHGQHLLVYEFHKCGSLHDCLHLYYDYSKPLTWNSRVKIALGTARALEYLHEVCSPSVVHKNIKSANILLDAELNPHLSDSGLGSLFPNADPILSRNAGSGYSAPEVDMSGQSTLKSDVYSFGVVMLELLSGRKPFDSTRHKLNKQIIAQITRHSNAMVSVVSASSMEPQTQDFSPKKSPSQNHEASETGRVFRSKLPDIPISNHLPLHTYCFEHLSEFSDRPCLIVGSTGKSYTFAETYLISQKVAAGLFNLGIRKGDAIMILLQNCVEFVFSFIGASMLGAVTTTANPFYTSAEVFKQFSASRAKLIISQSQYVEKLREPGEDYPKLGEDFTVITVDDPPEKCLHFSVLSEANESEIPTVSINPDDPVALPFSSGTTGLPKGVVLTHKSLITSVAQQVDGENPNLYLKPEDVVLCVLPLFHIYSLNSVLLCSLRVGAAVLLMQKFEISSLLELIQRHRISVVAVVPPLVLALAKNPIVEKFDLSSIRVVLSGAAPLGKELEEALQSRIPQAVFGQGYGMTEAGPVLSMCLGFAKEPFPTKSGSCGTVVRNAELKVIDPETGSSFGFNQPGEICIRGSQIMKGYLNDPEATASTIDDEGWLHTGDIGYVDDDYEIFIVDRVKELIKFKGFQVPPAELEALLVSHPSIADAAVVPQKNDVAGEVPVAFVVRSNGFELTEEAVKEFVAKQVVFYKRLHKVYFVHAIPKSPSGKILRKDLRAKLATSSPLPQNPLS